MERALFALVLPALLLAISTPSIAQQASATPSGFVYNVKLGADHGGSMDISMDFTIASTAQDGARSASVLIRAPNMPPLNGKKVDATISSAGAITIGSTGDLKAHYSPAQAKAMAAAATAPMLQMMIDPLNVFAAGCGAAPSQKIGTSWRVFNTMTQSDIVFTITGREQRSGRDTLAVTMATPSATGPSYSGKGNYDPSVHLVANVHVELRQSAQGGAQVVDAALANP